MSQRRANSFCHANQVLRQPIYNYERTGPSMEIHSHVATWLVGYINGVFVCKYLRRAALEEPVKAEPPRAMDLCFKLIPGTITQLVNTAQDEPILFFRVRLAFVGAILLPDRSMSESSISGHATFGTCNRCIYPAHNCSGT